MHDAWCIMHEPSASPKSLIAMPHPCRSRACEHAWQQHLAICMSCATLAMHKKLVTLLDLCVSSLRRGHANLLCIVPILTDDPRRESRNHVRAKYRIYMRQLLPKSLLLEVCPMLFDASCIVFDCSWHDAWYVVVHAAWPILHAICAMLEWEMQAA